MLQNNSLMLRKKLEALIVYELKNKLQQGKISGDRAKEIANIVLSLIPENISDQQLEEIIPKLDDKTPELASVVYQILQEKDEALKARMIPELKAMILQS